MNITVNKIIEKIGELLLLATIVTFNLIIGANEKGLRVLPISILMAVIVGKRSTRWRIENLLK